MLTGIGIDVIEIDRIEKMLVKWRTKFTKRLFSSEEISRCEKQANGAQCFAARFAAKEALAKALGHGWCEHFSWTDVEVLNEASGKPGFRITGKTSRLSEGKKIHLSLTHSRDYAAAVVVIESNEYDE